MAHTRGGDHGAGPMTHLITHAERLLNGAGYYSKREFTGSATHPLVREQGSFGVCVRLSGCAGLIEPVEFGLQFNPLTAFFRVSKGRSEVMELLCSIYDVGQCRL